MFESLLNRIPTKRSAWILLCILYLFAAGTVAVVMAPSDGFWGDENRYVAYAENLTQGYYADPVNGVIWNGPGYPFILAPFVAAGLPLWVPRLLNPLFLLGAGLLIGMCVKPTRIGVLAAAACVLYVPIWKFVPLLVTECLTFFLLALTVFLIHGLAERQDRLGPIMLGLVLAFLALTKVLFGYIVLIVGVLSFGVWTLKRSVFWKRMLLACLAAMVLTSPYLGYTYQQTGKFFFWAHAGGKSLYWMTTPYDDEYGDWQGHAAMKAQPILQERHGDLYARAASLSPTDQDALFKQEAMRNLREHPGKYVRNLFCNISRMLFSVPYSHTPFRATSLVYIVPNSLLLLACFLLFRRGGFTVTPATVGVLLLMLVYLGLSSLVSAYARQFSVAVPCLLYLLGSSRAARLSS